MTYLVERVEQVRDERTARTGSGQSVHQTEFLKIADETVGGILTEG